MNLFKKSNRFQRIVSGILCFTLAMTGFIGVGQRDSESGYFTADYFLQTAGSKCGCKCFLYGF